MAAKQGTEEKPGAGMRPGAGERPGAGQRAGAGTARAGTGTARAGTGTARAGAGTARAGAGERGGTEERARLSKTVVVDRALALADALGLEALTMRRLAQELGVTTMALYWHFRSKEELLGALGDRVWAEIDIDLDPAADWPAQLRGLLESLVGMLRAHPCASQLLLSGEKLHGEASLLATETALAVLQRGGFDAAHASEIARNALWTGLMLVMSEPGYDPGLSPPERAEQQRQVQIRLAMLPPARFPCLVAAAGPMTACDDPQFHYRFGIDLFVAGVGAVAGQA